MIGDFKSILHDKVIALKSHFHFLILYALIASLMLDWAEVYRLFQYLNMLAVIRFFYEGGRLERNKLVLILAIPIGYTVLHILAVTKLELISDVRHLWLAVFVVLGIWIVSYKDMRWLRESYASAAFILICSYVVIQLAGFVFEENLYGVMSNPHYLAFYSSLVLLMAVGEAFYRRGAVKYMLWVCILILVCFILYSSSRPAWLGLLLVGLIWPVFMPVRLAMLWVLAIPVVLFLCNPYGFADRIIELLVNIGTEERVAIWKVSLQMQMPSSWWEWLFGHGLESFLNDFIAYSEYHQQLIDFYSPHNTVLELIYISGIAGLLVAVMMYMALFSGLIAKVKGVEKNKPRMILLLMALAFNFIMIFLTMPFLSPYNMYTLAYIAGVLLVLGGNSIETDYSCYSKL